MKRELLIAALLVVGMVLPTNCLKSATIAQTKVPHAFEYGYSQRDVQQMIEDTEALDKELQHMQQDLKELRKKRRQSR